MSETVQADNGAQIPLVSIEQAFTYSAGFVETISAVYGGVTYVQTFTNNGSNITNITGWVAQ